MKGKNNDVIKEKHKLLTESGIDLTLKNNEGLSYLEKNTKLNDAISRIEKKRKVTM